MYVCIWTHTHLRRKKLKIEQKKELLYRSHHRSISVYQHHKLRVQHIKMEKQEVRFEEEPSTNPNDVQSSWFWPGRSRDDTSFVSDDDHDYYYHFEKQSKTGKLSDPKQLAVVEFVRELFLSQTKELFPRLLDKVNDAAKKSGLKLWRVKSGNSSRTEAITLHRSLSLGSGSSKYGGDPKADELIKTNAISELSVQPRGRPSGPRLFSVNDDVDPKGNEWIKITTINTGGSGDPQGGSGGQVKGGR